MSGEGDHDIDMNQWIEAKKKMFCDYYELRMNDMGDNMVI